MFRRPLERRRYPGGDHYVNGRYTKPEPEVGTIRASVQPASGKDLEHLPEGQRVTAAFRLYADPVTDLRTALEGEDGHPADTVVLDDGLEYEVKQVAPWRNGIISHVRALVTRSQPE